MVWPLCNTWSNILFAIDWQQYHTAKRRLFTFRTLSGAPPNTGATSNIVTFLLHKLARERLSASFGLWWIQLMLSLYVVIHCCCCRRYNFDNSMVVMCIGCLNSSCRLMATTIQVGGRIKIFNIPVHSVENARKAVVTIEFSLLLASGPTAL